MWGAGTRVTGRRRERRGQPASWRFATTEPEVPGERGAHPRPSLYRVWNEGPEMDKGLSRTHLSTHRLFIPGQLGGVLPCTLGHCPHSGLAPAVLCLGLWGQPPAAETWRLL